MADPNRPPAPFLPPEIVTQIIDSTTSKFYPLIARINSSWTTESQYRIFKRVEMYLNYMPQLRLLVPILESKKRLAQMVKSACIHIGAEEPYEGYYYYEEEDNAEGSEESQLVLRLLSKIQNLEELRISAAYEFTTKQRSLFFKKPLLPNLVSVCLHASSSDWNARTFECIIATAPNIQSIRFPTDVSEFRRCYPGRKPLRWKVYPKKLRRIYLDLPQPFSEGSIWPIEETYKGLEVLEVYHGFEEGVPPDFGKADNFFRVIAPTLKEFNVYAQRKTGIDPFIKDMVKLEKLKEFSLPDDPNFFITLSSTVKFIDITRTKRPDSLTEALINYQASGKNHLSFTHFEIYSNSAEALELNLAHIPTTQKLVLSMEFSIKDCLDELQVGEAKFKELEVRKEDFEDQGITRRCRELDIKLNESKEWRYYRRDSEE